MAIKFNGEVVSGTSAHPDTRINNAYQLMGFISGFNLFIGYLAVFWDIRILQNLGFGSYNLLTGSILLGLFLWGRKEKRFWPLSLGLFLFCIDAVLMVALLVQLRLNPGPGPILVRIILIIPWAKGVIEIYKKNKGGTGPRKL